MEMSDGKIRAVHRIAMCEPEKPWPAHVVEQLAAEVIRLRGTDTVWLALHGRDANQ